MMGWMRWGVIAANIIAINILIHLGMTSYLAWALDYAPALGEPIRGHLYPLTAWTWWVSEFADAYPDVIRPAMFGLALVLGGMVVWVLLLEVSRRVAPPVTDIHGSAQWGSTDDAEDAGLLAESGISLGILRGQWGAPRTLYHDGPEHVAVLAPTRAGKGVGIVVPTLLSWAASAVVYDQKGELWNLTAGWRAANVGPVFKFNPTDKHSTFRFNALGTIRVGEAEETADAQNLALILTEKGGKGIANETHWIEAAQSLLTGIILWACYRAREKSEEASIGDVVDVLTAIDCKPKELFNLFAINQFGPNGEPHAKIAAVGTEFGAKPEKELASIWSTASTCLRLYQDPIVARAMDGSTISISDIVDSDKPITVYIVTRESEKDRLKPLVRLFYTQLIRILLRREATQKSETPYKHRLLLLIDEFVSLGKMDYLQEALSFIAGYGIRALLVIQDISQLQSIYGRDNSILANTHVRVVFAPNQYDSAKWASDMLGKKTASRKERDGRGKSRHSIVARDLMTPDEVMRLKGLRHKRGKTVRGEQILFVAGYSPFLVRQRPFFLEPALLAATQIPPPVVDEE